MHTERTETSARGERAAEKAQEAWSDAYAALECDAENLLDVVKELDHFNWLSAEKHIDNARVELKRLSESLDALERLAR